MNLKIVFSLIHKTELKYLMSNVLKYNLKGIGENTLVNLYLQMLKPRLIEEKMLVLLRQGKISKWF